MSEEIRFVEVRLDRLEAQHKSLDAEVHGLAKVCADIKNIALTNQHDIAGLKVDVAGVKADIKILQGNISALTEATYMGFKRVDEQHNEFVKEVRERFDAHDKRFDEHDRRFDEHDKRFDQIDKRFDEHDRRFDEHDTRFDRIDKRFDQLEILIRKLLPEH